MYIYLNDAKHNFLYNTMFFSQFIYYIINRRKLFLFVLAINDVKKKLHSRYYLKKIFN